MHNQLSVVIISKNEEKFIAIDANFEDNTLYTDIVLFEKENNFKH